MIWRAIHAVCRCTSNAPPVGQIVSHYLLVVDQFEELFTLCHDEFEREAFIDNSLTTLTPAPRSPARRLERSEESGSGDRGEGLVTLILTIRADFYAHLAQYPELRDAVAQQQIYIGPMTVDESRRAIRGTGPAPWL